MDHIIAKAQWHGRTVHAILSVVGGTRLRHRTLANGDVDVLGLPDDTDLAALDAAVAQAPTPPPTPPDPDAQIIADVLAKGDDATAADVKRATLADLRMRHGR